MKDRSVLSNPAIADFSGNYDQSEGSATVQGTAWKSLLLVLILSLTFGYTWNLTTAGYADGFKPVNDVVPDSIDLPPQVIGLTMLGVLGGFVVAMVIIFNQWLAPYLSPVYAALEGLALGAISAGFEAKYPGIALHAIGATVGMTVGMLVLYALGILRPTAWFMVGLLICMLGILMLYLVDLIAMMFGSYVSIVHDNGPWGIVLQVFIVAIAGLNLIVDFGTITDAADNKAPKWFEWYGAFSLLVTLVWLYLEMLRLLGKLRGND